MLGQGLPGPIATADQPGHNGAGTPYTAPRLAAWFTPPAVAEQKPHLVLLDLRLRDGEAFDLMNALRLQFPKVAILVLSQCDEALYAERSLQAGARGYLMKQEATEELLGAIRTVVDGGVYLSRAMAARLLHTPFQNPALTPRSQKKC